MHNINGVIIKRQITTVFRGAESYDGAGVKLHRVFGGQGSAHVTDPFLLLDNFGSKRKEDYEKGFPWHPHRGIETVTYVLDGKVKHRDSTGVSGIIGSGELQWMTAGSGIFHEEMPQVEPEGNNGLQLWVNLPSASKMQKPKYRAIGKNNAPEIELHGGSKVRLIAGKIGSVEGPVSDLSNPVEYYHIKMRAGSLFEHAAGPGRTAIVYVLKGAILSGESSRINSGEAAVYDRKGDSLSFASAEHGTEVLLLTGQPLNEPVAWYGPIVMNTREEIVKAYEELNTNSFIKSEAEVEDL